MTRVGDGNPILIRREDVEAQKGGAKDWKKLEDIAALDGDASSISEGDLAALQNPRLAPQRASDAITASDLTARNAANGAIIAGGSGDAEKKLEVLAKHLQGKAGINIRRNRSGSVQSIRATPQRQEASGLSHGDLTTFLQGIGRGNPTLSFTTGAERASRALATSPDSVTTVEVNAADTGTLTNLVGEGYYPVAKGESQVTTDGPQQTETKSVDLGDLYSTAAYRPNSAKMDTLTGQLASMVSDGHTLSGLTISSGTDAQPVSAELFGRMADELLFSGKLEDLGFANPYEGVASYAEMKSATTSEARAAIVDRLRQAEAQPSGELSARFGDRPFNGNVLLAYARNAGVREGLLADQRLGLTTADFAEPSINASVGNPSGAEKYGVARHVDLEFTSQRSIDGEATTTTSTTYTMARHNPAAEIQNKVAIGFDVSGSITPGEKALFLQSLLDTLNAKDFDQVDFKVAFFNEKGLLGSGQTYSGNPTEVVSAMARDIFKLPAGTDALAHIESTIAQGQSARFDTTMGEMGDSAARSVPKHLMGLRNDLGGSEQASILVFSDIDINRMGAFEKKPFSFNFFNPAIN